MNKDTEEVRLEVPTRMPRKIPLQFEEDQNNQNNEEEEGVRLITEIRQFISKRLYKWDNNYEGFEFDLPPTIFSEKTKIQYHLQESLEVLYSESERSLKSEQFKDIWHNGQFAVNSKIEGLPYVWKLSQWTVKGYQNIKESLCYDLSLSFYYLYTLKHRFTFNQYEYFVCSIPSSFYGVLLGLWYITDLFIGLRNGSESKNTALIHSELRRNFILDLLRKFPQIDPRIFTMADYKVFAAITQEFNITWEKFSLKLEKELYDQNIPLGLTKLRIREDLNNSYIEFVSKSNLFTPEKRKLLVDCLKALMECSQIELEHEKRLKDSRIEIENELVIMHPVKSKVSEWKNQNIREKMNEKEKQLNIEKELRVSEKIANYEVPNIIWKEKCKFDENFDKVAEEQIKNTPAKFYGADEFIVTRYYMPPFNVKERYNEYNNRVEYYLEKHTNYIVKSECIFWRLWLFLVRYFAYTYNAFVFCLITCVHSSFGLKALCAEKIFMEMNVETYTGEVYYCNETFTYRSAVRNLFTWISESRTEFEEAPDTGIFGKNLARIINLINNYIFRLLICGAFVLIIYPITIILYSVLAIVLAFTAPVWMFGLLLIYQVFVIVFYDVDSRSFTCPLVPIFTYSVWHIAIRGLLQMAFTLVYLAVQPVFALFFFIFGLVRFLVRLCYDCLMYVIVRCCARLPHSDSGLAWKISGPGLSRKRFNHISLQDALTIVHAQMEKEQLYHFQEIVCKALEEPKEIFANKLSPLFKQVHLTLKDFPDNVYHYQRAVERQVTKRLEQFPSVNDVKFEAEEIEALRRLAQDYITEYVEKNKMQYIWKKHDLPEDSHQRLTDLILYNALGGNVLEPFDDADFRVELKKTFNSSYEELKNQLFDVKKIEKFSYSVREREQKKHNLPVLVSLTSIKDGNNIFPLNLFYLNEDDKRDIFGVNFKTEDI